MSHSREEEGPDCPKENGSGKEGHTTDGDCFPPCTSSNDTAHSCCLGADCAGDAGLDDRIRSALDELDWRSCDGVNGDLLASRTRTGATVEGSRTSDGSSSDSEGDEYCPNAMGYMPLPQDPEEDGERDHLDSGAVNTPSVPGEAVIEQRLHIHSLEPPEEDVVPRAPSVKTEDLEKDEVEAIKKVMSGFTLPSSAVPEWAKQVPEEVWKTELIGGLHGNPNKNTKPQTTPTKK